MDVLIAAVMALHLFFVSVSAVGPLVVAWCDWLRQPDDAATKRGGQWLASLSIVALLIGTVLGLILGWLLWSDGFRHALSRLHYKVAWGTAEWAFSVVLNAWLAVWWRRTPDCQGWRRRFRGLLGVLSGTNLLYHFSFLFFVLEQVEGDTGDSPITAALFREYMADGYVLAKAIHFMFAAIIMTGMAWMAAGSKWLQADAEDTSARRIATWGGRIAVVPAVLQLVVGLWVITQMDSPGQKVIMGGNMAASIIFIVSVLLALWLMHLTAMAALGKATTKQLRLAIVVTMVVVVMMLYVSRATEAAGGLSENEAAMRRLDPSPNRSGVVRFTALTEALPAKSFLV